MLVTAELLELWLLGPASTLDLLDVAIICLAIHVFTSESRDM